MRTVSLRRPIDKLPFTTCRIEVEGGGGGWTGTGFFYFHRFKGGDIFPLLVTNRHVLPLEAERFTFHIHMKSTSESPVTHIDDFAKIVVSNLETKRFFHPNPEIDLCAVPLGHVWENARRAGRQLSGVGFNSDEVRTQEQLHRLPSVLDVYMVGCPDGLWDENNKIPLIRKGITALPAWTNYRGKPEGLADIATFRGSSGSPLCYFDDWGNQKLLGIVYAVLNQAIDGTAIISEIGEEIPVTAGQRMHLALYVHSRELKPLAQIVLDSFAPNSGFELE